MAIIMLYKNYSLLYTNTYNMFDTVVCARSNVGNEFATKMDPELCPHGFELTYLREKYVRGADNQY